MARALTDMAYSTQNDLLAGFIDAIIKNDQLGATLISNAAVTDRPTIQFNRLVSAPTPVVADCSTSLTSQNMSGANVTVNLLTKTLQFDICDIGVNLYSTFTDQVQAEVVAAVEGFSNNLTDEAVGAGNGTSALFGMGSYLTSGQTISAGADGFDLGDMDYLYDTVLDKSGPMAFVGSPAAVRAVTRELREASALDVGQLFDTTFRVPFYSGIPILRSEFVDTTTDLFLVNLNTGYKLWFGTNPENKVGGVFGLQDIGPSQTKLAHIWRLIAHVNGVNLNPVAIAKLQGVQ